MDWLRLCLLGLVLGSLTLATLIAGAIGVMQVAVATAELVIAAGDLMPAGALPTTALSVAVVSGLAAALQA